jgi:pimeloyl-ACP methyl ester carboxylesterase
MSTGTILWKGLLAASLIVGWSSARAQDAAADDAAKAELEELLKESSRLDLETGDGVYLRARYWKPKDAGKTTPVVILVHGQNGSSRDLFRLGKTLMESGMAAIAFDFRGYGDSKDANPDIYVPVKDRKSDGKAAAKKPNVPNVNVVKPGTRKKEAASKKDEPTPSTKTIKLDPKAEFKNSTEFAKFAVRDFEAVRKYLVEQNNAGEFNIRQLGIVALDTGANITLKWLNDFEYPERGNAAAGWNRTSQDVSALVMVTPTWNYAGHAVPSKLAGRAAGLPVLTFSGSDKGTLGDTEKFAGMFRLTDLSDPKAKPPGNARKESGYVKLKSPLAGAKLLNPAVEELDVQIRDFLKNRLKESKTRQWEKRDADTDAGFGAGR